MTDTDQTTDTPTKKSHKLRNACLLALVGVVAAVTAVAAKPRRS